MCKISNILYAVLINLIFVGCIFCQAEKSYPTIYNEGFKLIEVALRDITKVPLVLPSSLPDSEDAGQFFGTIIIANRLLYEVVIGVDPICQGGNACRIGSLYGKRSKTRRITGISNYPFDKEKAKRVKLMGRITGYFVDSTCGANCSDSKVFWKQGGYEYMVGLKAANLKDVVKLANSAIKNRKPSKSAKLIKQSNRLKNAPI